MTKSNRLPPKQPAWTWKSPTHIYNNPTGHIQAEDLNYLRDLSKSKIYTNRVPQHQPILIHNLKSKLSGPGYLWLPRQLPWCRLPGKFLRDYWNFLQPQQPKPHYSKHNLQHFLK